MAKVTVWELSVEKNGHVQLFTSGQGIRDDRRKGWVRNLDTAEDGVACRTAYCPAAANLQFVMDWLTEQGEDVVGITPADTSFPSGTFWIITKKVERLQAPISV